MAADVRGAHGAGDQPPLIGVPLPTDASSLKTRSKKRSKPEYLFDFQLRQHNVGPFERNSRFHALRKWRFDFAFPQHKIAVEIEGLVVRRIGGQLVCMGRHASISGFREDCEKYAHAALCGWTVLRFEQGQVSSEYALEMTMRVLLAHQGAA